MIKHSCMINFILVLNRPFIKHGWLGSWYAYWVSMARPNLFYFDVYRSWILAYSALAIGVEKDDIEEDKAFGHLAKILHIHSAILGSLPCKIWSPMDNPFPSYKSWILAHSALATGVENYAIEDDNAFSHLAKILHIHSAILGSLPCKIWSPMDNPFPSYKSWILAHSALATGVENNAIEEDNAFIHLGEICCADSPI